MIALLGATGYTGRLVAAELDRRGIPHRRGGRSAARLAALPPSDAGEPFVVDADEPARLDAFLDGADALITTVGPFGRLGLPVVEAAVRSGVPYVDSTGEPDFMSHVYAKFADAPTPVVPACGFDYIPGDLAAAVAAQALGGDVAEVGVTYEIGVWLPSRGTARSALDVVEALELIPRRRRVAFPDGVRAAVEVPWGERLTVPRHLPDARVWSAVVVPGPIAPIVERVAAPAAVAGARLLGRVAGRLPEGPPDRLRARARFRVLVEAIGRRGRAAVLCEGRDVYGLTARFLVEAAGRVRGAGARSPAEALDAVAFLDAVSGDGALGSFAWRRA